jgi:large repetitive protein
MTVIVMDDCPDIYIPTGFSPNGDNNNDVYYVFGQISELNLVIYDRWGHVVFETTDQSKGWDGSCKGKQVESGVYGYRISLTDSQGNIIKKTGNITVVR